MSYFYEHTCKFYAFTNEKWLTCQCFKKYPILSCGYKNKNIKIDILRHKILRHKNYLWKAVTPRWLEKKEEPLNTQPSKRNARYSPGALYFMKNIFGTLYTNKYGILYFLVLHFYIKQSAKFVYP